MFMKSLSSLLPCKFPDLGINQLVKFMTTLQWLLLKQNSILATTLLIKAFRFLGKTFVEFNHCIMVIFEESLYSMHLY